MKGEAETKRLLSFRESLERRIGELKDEIEDIREVISEIDRMIVKQGFRKPALLTTTKTPETESEVEEKESISINARDGTILGRISLRDDLMVFEPEDDFEFVVDVPPFQSFFIDRVLSNMKETDRKRSADGEISSEEMLDFEVITDDSALRGLIIKNYRDKRRLREIQSSLRWTLDKMYDRMKGE